MASAHHLLFHAVNLQCDGAAIHTLTADGCCTRNHLRLNHWWSCLRLHVGIALGLLNFPCVSEIPAHCNVSGFQLERCCTNASTIHFIICYVLGYTLVDDNSSIIRLVFVHRTHSTNCSLVYTNYSVDITHSSSNSGINGNRFFECGRTFLIPHQSTNTPPASNRANGIAVCCFTIFLIANKASYIIRTCNGATMVVIIEFCIMVISY